MVTARYCLLSIGSGCIWGAIGYQLGHRWMSPFIWGAVFASPLIGLAVGLLYRPARRSSLAARVFLSLATLYAAVTLFGLAAGIYDAFRFIPPSPNGDSRIPHAVILQAIVGAWWGITFTGYFLVLWPLSFVNHEFVCRFGNGLTRRCGWQSFLARRPIFG